MTHKSHPDLVLEKFELPAELREEFKRCCAFHNESRAHVLRLLISGWVESERLARIEEEKKK